MSNHHQILEKLGLQAVNPGACFGPGQWSEVRQDHLIESFNPTTGQVIARVSGATEAEYEKVLRTAQEAAEAWKMVPAPVRGDAVRRITQALRDYKDPLGSLVSMEMGKIKAEGDGEVQEMIDIGDFAVGQSRMMYGKTMHSERPGHRMYEQWHPLGVVGVVTAFNFPVAVWAWNALLAAVCGNATIWKPSPKGALCCAAVQNIANEALAGTDVPPIFTSFMEPGHELAEKFVDDERVALMSFTGSCQIGRQVGERVARRMGKSLLELGGNNAIIIDETADLKLAIPAVVFGAVGTAGQRCTTTRRLFIHESIADQVIETLVKAYGQVRIGDPLDPNTLMGPLTDEAAVQRFEQAVARAKEAGGEVLTGGERIEGDGYFVKPAIIRAENHWDIVQEETFAPILYVMTFKTLDEAMAMHNDVKQGLSSSIFTTDVRNAEYFLSHRGSDCGIANVNIGTSGAEIGGAFGGEKETGGGRESGSDAWQAYMRRQTNTINWSTELPLAQGIKFDL
ncbi:L-piperidine-6-carboxylate dehydrogenase [Wenzhouxiangella marina]|uniref:aldehyde dehydrogenase (NAD(+)) n=1 Tax=Wenzhouxiangella marina TaxID=1579979 RepID=A0A0K0XXT9_9GAMM|nr:aldehyde dehydrogenase family protein [Wenzhouxiangella marina]AKS42447.1 Aldehyde Dehydrogenase [Wenzhouxiangella marina]MBB6085778.1 aldehyde dehydrogenase (NAD+) [Wenzhouxiangella marina]